MTAASKHAYKSKSQLIAELEILQARVQEQADDNAKKLSVEETLKAALEALPDGLVIFDAEDRLVFCNAKHHELYPAVTDAMVPGFHFENIMRMAAERGHNIDATGQGEAWLKARLEAFHNPGEPIEQAFVDGSWRRVYERKTADGGTVGVRIDITELKQREQQLEASQQRQNDYLEASSDWYWEMDEHCRFSFFSDRFEEVTSVPPAMLLGRTREETGIPDVDPVSWRKHLDNLAARRSFRDFRHGRTRRDGTVVTLSINGKAIFNAEGNFAGYRGTGRDISELVAAEQNARRAEELLAKAIESISDGFALYDAEDRLVICNEKYREIASGISDLLVPGAKSEDLLRAAVERGIVEIAEGHAKNWIDGRLAQIRAGNAIRELRLSNGRWVQAIDRRTEDGGYLGIRTDITEKKNAEAASLERERRYRQIFSSADICLWDEDFSELLTAFDLLRGQGVTDLRAHLGEFPDAIWQFANCIKVNQVNEATLRLFGAASEEELLGSLERILPESAQDLFLEEMVAIWEGKTSFRAEAKHQSFSGEDIWVIVTMPIPRRREDFRSIPISVIDITEKKKQAEEELARYQDELLTLVDERTRELRETEAYLTGAIESISEGFILYGPDDRMIMCNSRYKEFYPLIADDLVPGVTLGAVVRNSIERGVVKDAGDNREYWSSPQLEQQGAGLGSHEQELPDGRWLLCRERKTANGFTVGIRTDITEVKAVAENLRQSQKMETIGQLTGGVAHDFNNILAAIIGNLDLIEIGQKVTDPSDREGIAIALRAAQRGAELTDRLLVFSRQQPLYAKVTEVEELLPPFRELAMRTIGEDIAIDTKCAPGLWPTMVDPGQLENALLNLIINARDAMPKGGRISIEAKNRNVEKDSAGGEQELAPGGYVVIAVSDDGTGMPENVRARVFEPFFTTKEIGAGSGLGLSMVFGFAKQSGGHVSVHSGDDAGTTVRIYLPGVEQTKNLAAASRAPSAAWATGDETILVVEDDNDIRKYLVKLLRRLGYAVLEAEDGPSSLEIMAASGAIDLLLTDVIMPRGMSGRDVADAFVERYPGAGVLYSSGYTQEVLDSRGALEAGVTLMNKPYQARPLAETVRQVLDGRPQS